MYSKLTLRELHQQIINSKSLGEFSAITSGKDRANHFLNTIRVQNQFSPRTYDEWKALSIQEAELIYGSYYDQIWGYSKTSLGPYQIKTIHETICISANESEVAQKLLVPVYMVKSFLKTFEVGGKFKNFDEWKSMSKVDASNILKERYYKYYDKKKIIQLYTIANYHQIIHDNPCIKTAVLNTKLTYNELFFFLRNCLIDNKCLSYSDWKNLSSEEVIKIIGDKYNHVWRIYSIPLSIRTVSEIHRAILDSRFISEAGAILINPEVSKYLAKIKDPKTGIALNFAQWRNLSVEDAKGRFGSEYFKPLQEHLPCTISVTGNQANLIENLSDQSSQSGQPFVTRKKSFQTGQGRFSLKEPSHVNPLTGHKRNFTLFQSSQNASELQPLSRANQKARCANVPSTDSLVSQNSSSRISANTSRVSILLSINETNSFSTSIAKSKAQLISSTVGSLPFFSNDVKPIFSSETMGLTNSLK